MVILFTILVFLFSVIIHEVSHGLMAQSMGDDTAKRAGRLTLNPFPHLDMYGSILVPLMTFLAFGAFFGYAKPVPYNPANLSDQRFGASKVAIAGPLSNLLLAIIFGLFLRFLPADVPPILPILFLIIVRVNLLLMVFNLIPIQPLDGHWLLLTFLPNRWIEVKYFVVRYGIFMFFALLIILYHYDFLTPLINFLFRVIVGEDISFFLRSV